MSHKEKKKRKKKYRGFWLFVKLQIVLILLVIGGLAYYYFGGYASQVSAMHEEAVRFVKESTKDTFRAEQTSQVYDVNGTRIMSLRGTKDVSYLTSDEIPEEVKEAMVSIEDKKFYSHGGIDFKAIIRAVWAMVRNGANTAFELRNLLCNSVVGRVLQACVEIALLLQVEEHSHLL